MKTEMNDRRLAIALDTLLLQALQESSTKVEGLAWEGIVSRNRARIYADARTRIYAAYRDLSPMQDMPTISAFLRRDRTTLIYMRQHHAALLLCDWVYRRKYGELLKAAGDRYALLKAAFIESNNITQKEETMFTSTISGKLGRDAEVITLRDKSYYKINVAVEGKGKDAPITWVQVLYYKSDNSRLGEHLRSGAGIVAQGRLEVKAFNKRDGGTGIDITLWADTLELTKYAEKTASRSGYNDEDSF